MRVLIVEDEHRIAQVLKKGLEQERYAVDLAYSGNSGLELALSETYDIIILDRMLPEMDGITICKELRKDGIQTPVLLLTAKGQLDEKVEGLDAGADDYLLKPFAFEELLARLRALIRRPAQMVENVLTVEDLTIDTIDFTVQRAGKTIQLSSKEFALLEYLMRNHTKIVSKEQIIAHVWNYEADILPNTVEVFIGYLRKKIDKSFSGQALIHTVRGFGYRLGTAHV